MKKFTLKSGNTTSFKKMGSSPAKQAIGGDAGEAIDHWNKYKRTKKVKANTMPKNFNMTDKDTWVEKSKKLLKKSKKVAKKVGKKVIKGIGGKTLGVAGMMMATSSKADQPTKGKGKVEYPGGKIDFTK